MQESQTVIKLCILHTGKQKTVSTNTDNQDLVLDILLVIVLISIYKLHQYLSSHHVSDTLLDST